MTDFNPRSHEGSDRASPNTNIHSWHFNPRSHEGSDVAVADRMRAVDISIHAPTRGATFLEFSPKAVSGFQSTLPRGERPIVLYLLSLESYFNPRSHEGSDNGRFWSRAGSVYFNPRSHEGSDMRSEWMYITCSYFNPRSHEGSDETMRRSYAKDQRFQSTLPRGERL